MNKDTLTVILLTLILSILLCSMYFINEKISLLVYANTKSLLEREQLVIEATIPYTGGVKGNKHGGR